MFDNLNDALLHLRRNSGPSLDPLYYEACAMAMEQRRRLPYRVPIKIDPGNSDQAWQYLRDRSLAISPDGLERLIEPSVTNRVLTETSGTEPVKVRRGKLVVLATVGSWGKTAHLAMTISADGDDLIGVFDPLIGIPDLPNPSVTRRRLRDLWVPGRTVGRTIPVHMLHRSTTGKTVVVPLAIVMSSDTKAGTVTLALDRAIERWTPRMDELEAGKWGCLDIRRIVDARQPPSRANPMSN